ncbi:MAG: glycosyltransferase [Bacteroidales bacterium]
MHISTVMPAYNEGSRLAAFLEEWAGEALRRTSPIATARVVDDGSRGDEAARQRRAVEDAAVVLRRAGAPHTVVYHRSDRNRGKGASIRWGWSLANADADWLGFIDSDGAVPAREYWRLADQLPISDADVVCGSRVNMAGRHVERSLFRHLQGRAFATLVEELFHLGFYDTQCGMKFFRGPLLRPLLPYLEEERWLLDVEVLSLLERGGARCVEAPIDCQERGGSALVFGLDPIRMAVRLVRLRSRLRRRAEPGARGTGNAMASKRR